MPIDSRPGKDAWLWRDGRVWVDSGCSHSRPSRHVYFDRPVPAQRAGVIDHMAFAAHDLRAVKARFDASVTKYDLRQQAGASTWQLFCHDPNGAKVELDFDASECL